MSTPAGALSSQPDSAVAGPIGETPGIRIDFERLVMDERERVARLAYRLLGWSHEAEDVVQDVFVTAMRQAPRFRGQARVSTWLARITINLCRSRLRRKAIFGRWFEAVRRTTPREAPAYQPPVDEQVRAAVRALPWRYREVVVLRYLEELSVDEICALLGARRGAIEVRLNRAREMLRLGLAGLEDER